MRSWRFIRWADQWTIPQRAAAASALVAMLLALAILLSLLNPWLRAAALFSDIMLMEAGVRPLTWVTQEPQREWIEWGEGGRGQFVLPAGVEDAPALVLTLGARPAAPSDPRVMQITDALARIGFVVLLPQSEDLGRGVVAPRAVDQLVRTVVVADEHPRTRAGSTLLVGLSVGGSLSLIAATDERLEGRLAGVLAFGAYYDAGNLLAAAAAERVSQPGGGTRPWGPDATTDKVLAETLHALPVESEQTARAIEELLGGIAGQQRVSLEAAEAAVTRIQETHGEWLQAISPRGQLEAIEAPWFVIHDYGDELIPYEESERMALEHEPELFLRIDIFEHVTPDLTDLGPLVGDGAALIDAFARLIELSRE